MRGAVPESLQQWLEALFRLLHGNYAGSPHEVCAVVHVAHTDGVGNLLRSDNNIGHIRHSGAKFSQAAVILGTSIQLDTFIAHALLQKIHDVVRVQSLKIQEGTRPLVLGLKCLAKLGRRSNYGTLDGLGDGPRELLLEHVRRLPQVLHAQRVQLLLDRAQLGLGLPHLHLEHGHDLRHVPAVVVLHALLQERAQVRRPHLLQHAPRARAQPPPDLRLVGQLQPPAAQHEVLVGVVGRLAGAAHAAAGHAGEERPAQHRGVQPAHDLRPEEVLQVPRLPELRDLGVQLRGHNHRAGQVRVHLLDNVSGTSMLPIRSVLHTENNVIFAVDFIQNQSFGFARCLKESSLLVIQISTGRRLE
mmetsp:Transcript_45166/g.79704  ORF Transcript_45166/g.79704 Transcript_45166/m.79704 type:complete len:359 (-) Transcript_45166:714-1790(-)